MNNILQLLNESATVKLADEVRRRKGLGVNVIELQTGDPDFNTPQAVSAACLEAINQGKTHYTFSKGDPLLRLAVANKLASYNGIKVNPDTEVVITHGGVHAYHCAMSAILNAGDEVLIPDPSWMSHYNVVRYNLGVPVAVPAYPEDGFVPAIAEFEKLVTPKTKAIVINFPSNPTGAVATSEYLKELYALAVKYNLYIISDEVYEYILFNDNRHFSIGSLEDKPERVITINSLSKTYAMTGWRVGYLSAAATIIKEVTKILQCTITNIAPFIQAGAIEALTSENVKNEVSQMVKTYQDRYNYVVSQAATMPSEIKFKAPSGAFYFFIDVRPLGIKSEEIAMQLLEKKNMAIVPGNVFGSNGEGFLRMTIAASDTTIQRGMAAIKEWLIEL
jgi:aspartate/methionine/tyrosine aminotransferase